MTRAFRFPTRGLAASGFCSDRITGFGDEEEIVGNKGIANIIEAFGSLPSGSPCEVHNLVDVQQLLYLPRSHS